MLDINPDTVCWIAGQAREFQSQESVDLGNPPEALDDEFAMRVLSEHADDLTYQNVKATIEDLEPDQQACLVALMWLGRGDYTLDEWDEVASQAEAAWTPRTAEYLLATPMLSEYLLEGLALHGHSCAE